MSRAWWSLAHVVALLAATVPCASQEPPPAHAAAPRAEAAARFEEGTKAFEGGDFRRAAEAFDAAYGLAPNIDTLWNAARAWHRGGENARAATLYARYLRDAPPGAADRAAATRYLAALSRTLARIDVHGDDIVDLTIDDVPSPDRVVYVSRGAHVVSATAGGKRVRKDQPVEAGEVVSVVLGPSADAGPVAPRAPEGRAPARSGGRWSPWVFVAGAALSSVAVGLTIASGVDTDNALRAFEAQKTSQGLSDGQAKQVRTNVLLGAAIGLGAVTAAAGIWLVDWHKGGQRVQVGLVPGGLGVSPKVRAAGAIQWSF